MQSPSSLSQLSHAEKDALILMMQEQIAALQQMVSQAGVIKASQSAKHLLLPTVQAIGQAYAASAVLHADEQGRLPLV